ncbi:Calmodulin [Diplonema papillatum]|nr:Calmodulin [Diplonema papillatum]
MAFSAEDIPTDVSDAWHDVYNAFAEADDELNIRDLGKAIRAAGQCPTNEQLQSMIEDVQGEPDADQGTRISWAQFERLMVTCMNEFKTEQDLREALCTFDKDNDGYITLSELRFFLTTMGDTLEPEEMQELVTEAQNSGCFDSAGVNLSIDEFIKKVMPPLPGQ